MRRRSRRGFSLIEVIAAFAIALLMIGPIAGIISGIAGSFAGLERSAQRRADLQAAGAVAMTASPLKPGTLSVGDFLVTIEPFDPGDGQDLAQAGWRLYSVAVSKGGLGARGPVLETIRIGRL
jgi:prepilin-type N-terminal cleavage/methylation domain-containing protein